MNETEQQHEKQPPDHQRWIGGSILVHNFEDQYDLDDLIHHGEFADVYKCRLKNRQALRAVRCIPKGNNRKTPIKNGSIVLQLDHPNLVVLREILESPSHIYIVQDYIDGPNLFQKIGRTENYTEHDVSKYTSQILKALQYMHERQIYHGKLHGENVLIRTVDNEEKLCLVDYAYTNLCTRDAITLLVNASPSFCAPEILRGETLSPATDMWQLGILIFYCLGGTYPFQGNRREIFKKILNGKIEYNPSEWDHISSNGRTFVGNLLKVNVRDRLTINQALSHPWIREKVYRTEKLSHVQEKFAGQYIYDPPAPPAPPPPPQQQQEQEHPSPSEKH